MYMSGKVQYRGLLIYPLPLIPLGLPFRLALKLSFVNSFVAANKQLPTVDGIRAIYFYW